VRRASRRRRSVVGVAAEVPTFVFAGGGTGGHLFPALALAERLRELAPECRCVFVCSSRPIDARILSGAGESFTAIRAQPFGLRPRALARFCWNWGGAVRASRGVIARERAHGPVVVVAMGGFAAAPVVQAARAESVPVALVNLDAAPGKANRWIARHASAHLTAAEGPEVPATWARLRPIVRAGVLPSEPPEECRRRLGLDPDRPTLLVTGGSQGASTIGRALAVCLRRDPGAFAGWQSLHQCGGDEETEVREAYERAGVPAAVVRFIENMGDAWGSADLSVGRAGAGTVAEAWAAGVPSVFLPYPFHADEHQRKNAAVLVDAGGALVCTDSVDAERTADDMLPLLRPLLSDAARRDRMREMLRGLGPADGASEGARRILGLVPGPISPALG